MKYHKSLFMIVFVLLFLYLPFCVSAQYSISNSTFSNGASVQSNSSYVFSSSIGEPGIGSSTGIIYSEQSGWWYIFQNLSLPVYRLDPPFNVQIRDISGDHGHFLKITWDKSPSENSGNVKWYRVYRSRSSSLTDPVSISRYTSVESLIDGEALYTILVDSVAVGTTEYIDSVPLNKVNYYYWIQAVGDNSVSEKAVSGITTFVEHVPGEFCLNAPYPNPFNPVTNIEFSLPQDTHVSLIIYNVSGQLVDILKDGYSQSGYYTILWDAKGKPSGLYFCTLKVNNITDTKKMLLLR